MELGEIEFLQIRLFAKHYVFGHRILNLTNRPPTG
jgi:hypothetical protein